jgi:formamidopyrimidine-DNA glycosylase
MPELPEVETIKEELLPRLKGYCFINVDLLRPEAISEPLPAEFYHRLIGQRLKDISRRGKYLLFRLSSGETLILHLKMTGSLLLLQSHQLKLKPALNTLLSHTTAIFHLDTCTCNSNGKGENKQLLYFCDPRKLGKMWLVTEESKIMGKLGVEPLSSGFSAQVLGTILASHRAPVKALLCDQHLIAGIGNMYADESLFFAGIHPLRKGNSLSGEEINHLYITIQTVLNQAINRKGASTDNYRRTNREKGEAQFAFQVAHRGGKRCYFCGTFIERVKIRGRSAYFCPYCQKEERNI